MDANRSLNANLADHTEFSSIGITRNKVARIENGRGLRLRVETGTVWITQDGSQDDVCLSAGESCCIERDGMTLISTLKGPFALVTIEPTVPIGPTMGERFCNLWAALSAGKRATDAFRDFDEIAALSSFGLTRGYALRLITRQPN